MAVAPWVEIKMQIVAGELSVNQFYTTQLNDAVAALCREACSFGV